MKRFISKIFILLLLLCVATSIASAEPFVGIMNMKMGIFPGTAQYLEKTIKQAGQDGAVLLIVELDTPGGMLNSSQDIIKLIFDSPVPIAFYVTPAGAMAASAGVFITVASHVAAMAPGTSIGAAHPVMGDGKDIPSDMRAKAENMTVAMIQSIVKQRGRNVAWVEKAVRESVSITDTEAQKQGVVDLVAKDIDDLLRQIKGKEVQMGQGKVTLKDYSALPKQRYEISVKDKTLNALSDPQIMALLWLGATTGLSIELYNPGAILPAVVGIICLVLALLVSQVIPVNTGAIALIVIGTLMIGAELFVPSGILAVGGLIALVIGSLYIVDPAQNPGLTVNVPLIIGMATLFGLIMISISYVVVSSRRKKSVTGESGVIGLIGSAVENIAQEGRVFVNGEYWKAESDSGIIEKGAKIKVIKLKPGLVLEVTKVE